MLSSWLTFCLTPLRLRSDQARAALAEPTLPLPSCRAHNLCARAGNLDTVRAYATYLAEGFSLNHVSKQIPHCFYQWQSLGSLSKSLKP
jgi:hypothetical protein